MGTVFCLTGRKVEDATRKRCQDRRAAGHDGGAAGAGAGVLDFDDAAVGSEISRRSMRRAVGAIGLHSLKHRVAPVAHVIPNSGICNSSQAPANGPKLLLIGEAPDRINTLKSP